MLIARRLAVALLIAATVAFVWTAIQGGSNAPGYALGSPVVYAIERAVVALVLVAVPAVFIAQLLAGNLPQSLTTSGVTWRQNQAELAELLDELAGTVDDQQKQIDNLTNLVGSLQP
jgi:hypothetical protein